MGKIRTLAKMLLVIAFALSPFSAAMAKSTLIKNALIYDGLGSPPIHADLRIQQDKILSIGQLSAQKDDVIIDATGLALAPGFIDVHSHHAWALKKQPAPKAILAQGVTTVVTGVDGKSLPDGKSYQSVARLFSNFEASPAAVNIASYAAHNSIRAKVMGFNYQRPATAAEVDKMAEVLHADMRAGALGLSTGLEYEPGLYADVDEVISLTAVAKQYGGGYSSHIRNEDITVEDAIDELLNIGEKTGAHVHISHIKMAMYSKWGKSSMVLDKLNAARKKGITVTADIYPYDGWQAPMRILLPQRDYNNRASYEFALKEIVPADRVIITSYFANPSFVGKTLADIAAGEGRTPVDQMMLMLKTAVKEDFLIFMIGRNMYQKDIESFMSWPYTAIASDGMTDDHHPRGQGSYAKVLAEYVRNKNLLTLPDAIRKMTSFPAEIAGIKKRGTLKAGYYADLVLFDPRKIQDKATFDHPLNYAVGVNYVWVNGELIWDTNKATDKRPGKVLRLNRE